MTVADYTGKRDRPSDNLLASRPNDVSTEVIENIATRASQTTDDIKLAKSILRGPSKGSREMYELAERLRQANEFGRARRLYRRVREAKDTSDLQVTLVKVGQRQALATYKDPNLPAQERLRKALEILDEVEKLDPAAPSPAEAREGKGPSPLRSVKQRQESLGLRGAIHKRRWQNEGQRVELERAFGYYFKGYNLGREFSNNQLGVETDQGYCGVNAAFILDLLALEEAKQAQFTASDQVLARQRADQARAIRTFLADSLPQLLDNQGYAWLKHEWWFHASLAEAQLGLGRSADALKSLQEFNIVHGLKHLEPPLEKLPRWEFESTLVQLTALAELYAQLTTLLDPHARPAAEAWTSQWRKEFRQYLGSVAPAMDRVEMGKVGLALSGGGMRAALFHIGVLAQLAERDLLRRIEVLSCVSGGSIVGAHYYLEVRNLLRRNAQREISAEQYCELVERVCAAFMQGVQRNIRSRVFASIWANLRALFQPGYTTTRYLGELYESELYANVKDGEQDKPRCLPDLTFTPADENELTFAPKYDNWRRSHKVPTLILNATTLNTGHNWQFTASFMGEPPSSIDAEIEGNYRLRRMYYHEAPQLKDRWKHRLTRPFAPPDYRRMRLGEAVAASSCVPGLFEPIVLTDLYEGKVVRLVDGGVYDNQGVAGLLEQDCNVLIVSDASGQMGVLDQPASGRLGVSLRSFSVSMTRVRQAQYREIDARSRSGLLKRFAFLHLKRDLDADPVDWRDCQEPFAASDDATPAAKRGVLTSYSMQKSVQQLLSNLRTDLDSFSELEAYALMTSGYLQTKAQLDDKDGWPAASERKWAFLKAQSLLDEGTHFEEVKRLLGIGAQSGFKVFSASLPHGVIAVFAALLLLVLGAYFCWSYRNLSLLSVGSLATISIALIASVWVPQLVAVIRYKQTVRGAGIKSAIGLVLALVFKLHLALFDRVFLNKGKLDRFRP